MCQDRYAWPLPNRLDLFRFNLSMNWLLLYNSNLCVSISFCKIQIYLHFLSLLNNEMAKMIKMLSRIIQLTATLHRQYHGCQCLGGARNQGISNYLTYDIIRIILLVCSKYGVILCQCWVMQHIFSKTFHRIYSMLVRHDIFVTLSVYQHPVVYPYWSWWNDHNINLMPN